MSHESAVMDTDLHACWLEGSSVIDVVEGIHRGSRGGAYRGCVDFVAQLGDDQCGLYLCLGRRLTMVSLAPLTLEVRLEFRSMPQ
jgi:hypothetical protein